MRANASSKTFVCRTLISLVDIFSHGVSMNFVGGRDLYLEAYTALGIERIYR